MSLTLAQPVPSSTLVDTGERIRILVVTDTAILGRGGSERFLCNLIGGLDPARFEVDVIQLIARPADRDLLRALPPGGHVRIEYRPVGAVYGPAGIAVYRDLRQRVLSGRYQIVQSQHEKSDLLCALLPRPRCCRLWISNRRDTGFQKSRLLRHAFRLLNQRFDRFVAPSRAVLEILVREEAVDHERTVCLPNGVDTDRFAPLPMTRRADARSAAGLPPHAFLFGSVARLVEVKRHCDMIDGFARAVGERTDARLVLVGGGPLEDQLRVQAARLGVADRVHFMGERSDIEKLLPLFDVFVLSSRTEGMSNAVLEAMACGLPTIATAVGGNPETLDPHTGLLVPAMAPDRLGEAMSRLLADPQLARELGQRARRRALAAFSMAAMVSGFTELYRVEAMA